MISGFGQRTKDNTKKGKIKDIMMEKICNMALPFQLE